MKLAWLQSPRNFRDAQKRQQGDAAVRTSTLQNNKRSWPWCYRQHYLRRAELFCFDSLSKAITFTDCPRWARSCNNVNNLAISHSNWTK